jgi:hypothetical protein
MNSASGHRCTKVHRVLNVLYRVRLSHGHMIWLLAHLLSPVSELDLRHTRRQRQLADGRERKGRGTGGVESYDHRKIRSSINNKFV